MFDECFKGSWEEHLSGRAESLSLAPCEVGGSSSRYTASPVEDGEVRNVTRIKSVSFVGNSDGIGDVMYDGGTWKKNVDVGSETESLCGVQNGRIEKHNYARTIR